MKFTNKSFLKIIFLIFLSHPLLSCSKAENINSSFEKKYGQEIQRMREARGLDRMGEARVRNPHANLKFSTPPTQAEVERQISKGKNYQPYVGIKKFGQKASTTYRPNAEVYETQHNKNPSNSLPDDMFYITYNTQLSPPFRRAGREFDLVNIPEYDAYGVRTEMSDKKYLLAGNNSVQRSVDEINATRSRDDIEISQILIKERRAEKRQKKTIRVFGRNLLAKAVEIDEVIIEDEVAETEEKNLENNQIKQEGKKVKVEEKEEKLLNQEMAQIKNKAEDKLTKIVENR